VLSFADAPAFHAWLAKHHASSNGIRLRFLKKAKGEAKATSKTKNQTTTKPTKATKATKTGKAAAPAFTQAQAVEVAIAWGWIDSQAFPLDELAWLQRFTPRRKRSPWSKINRARAEALIAGGRMHPPGLAEVERAKGDGRWESAYTNARAATVPADLAAALARNPRARAFFEELDRANRYAILYRVETAKQAETRAARIARFVEMCARGEKLHEPRRKNGARA
jgi:uncharacterized protein YdeI (YjbR/CyaY-like superfamily)